MKRLLLLMIFAPLFVHGQIITTIAGNGMSGLDSGDGGQATAATINPDCIAIDKDGAIYFSNGRIVRKIDSAGIITTVAGTGVFGYNGDGIQATMANLKHISSIALDRNKNLFIADSYDYRVRKVNALTGIISTIAGNGLSGLGYPWPSNGGQATAASLSLLGGICVDKWDNLCITGFDHVLKVDTAGIISVVAGDSTHPWSFPFTSPAPATSTGILDPTNICTDTFGNLYFDFYYIRHRSVTKLRGVLKLDINGMLYRYAGNGYGSYEFRDGVPATNDSIMVGSLTCDNVGNLYFSDLINIRRVDTNGLLCTVAGNHGIVGFSGDGGPATNAQLDGPRGIATDASGNLYIADERNNRIRKVSQPECGYFYNETPEIKNVNNINVYPNPIFKQLTISATENINSVVIYSMFGQMVREFYCNTQKVEMDVSILPAGIYLIRINGTEVRKFVKE